MREEQSFLICLKVADGMSTDQEDDRKDRQSLFEEDSGSGNEGASVLDREGSGQKGNLTDVKDRINFFPEIIEQLKNLSNNDTEEDDGAAVTHIVGGKEASPNQFPYIAALFVDRGWFCGGSIISEVHNF